MRLAFEQLELKATPRMVSFDLMTADNPEPTFANLNAKWQLYG